MGFREDLGRKIDKKRGEINDLEAQLMGAKAYLQALEDMYKMAARDGSVGAAHSQVHATKHGQSPSLRAGSMTRAAYEALKSAGHPLHVNLLLPAIGRGLSRADRSALSGTLAAYIRKGEVFTRPAPNTFGLVEFGEQEAAPTEPTPPPGFGKL